jgi:hypothetical protein
MELNVLKIQLIISITVSAANNSMIFYSVSEKKLNLIKLSPFPWKIMLNTTTKIPTKKIVTFYSDLPDLSEFKDPTPTKKLIIFLMKLI